MENEGKFLRSIVTLVASPLRSGFVAVLLHHLAEVARLRNSGDNHIIYIYFLDVMLLFRCVTSFLLCAELLCHAPASGRNRSPEFLLGRSKQALRRPGMSAA